jgi:uncharacterized protein
MPVNWIELEALSREIVRQIKVDDWRPTVIVALSRGGLVPATMIGLELGITDVVGIDVQKRADGTRTIGKFVSLQNLDEQTVLVIDEGTVSGKLLQIAADAVRQLGGDVRTCTLVSEGKCDAPDYLAEVRNDISDFPWQR